MTLININYNTEIKDFVDIYNKNNNEIINEFKRLNESIDKINEEVSSIKKDLNKAATEIKYRPKSSEIEKFIEKAKQIEIDTEIITLAKDTLIQNIKQ